MSHNNTDLARHAPWYNSDISIMGRATHFLPYCSTLLIIIPMCFFLNSFSPFIFLASGIQVWFIFFSTMIKNVPLKRIIVWKVLISTDLLYSVGTKLSYQVLWFILLWFVFYHVIALILCKCSARISVPKDTYFRITLDYSTKIYHTEICKNLFYFFKIALVYN